MLYYDLGPGVEAWTTNIGDIMPPDVMTPDHQAHSTNVRLIPDERDDIYGVDALITDREGVAVGVRTADCVPILVYDPARRAVGAIHSGWKGTLDNIIAAAVGRMVERFGSRPADMRAVIGPCIHVEAFEVGDELYELFASAGYGSFCRRMSIPWKVESEEKWHIDLPTLCRRQLADLGVERVEVRSECTFRDHDRFYSYRFCHIADRSHRLVSAIRLLRL